MRGENSMIPPSELDIRLNLRKMIIGKHSQTFCNTILIGLCAALLFTTASYSKDPAELTSCDNWFKGKTAGYQFWGRASEEAVRECVQKYGINRRTPFHATPLLHALAYRNVKIRTVDVLISLGADVNAKNKFHVTPLMMAARYASDPAIIKLLVKKGAKVDEQDIYGVDAEKILYINPGLSRDERADLVRILSLSR